MTVNLNLPARVEQAYLTAAQANGVSLDVLVSDVLLSHPIADSGTASEGPELIEELGIPVLRTGRPIAISAVDDTLNEIRRERDLAVL